MPYQADVKDISYRYDGSFPGFLCCVFESYAKKEIPTAVLSPENDQMTMFDVREIPTDSLRAKRVYMGLGRLGGVIKDRIMTGFLNTDPSKDLILVRYARLCFDNGPSAAQMISDVDGAAAFALARAVGNEAHLMREFIRFEQRGDMLGAVIHPRHYVLPLLRAPFCSRLPDENFLIFDATHGTALVRRGNEVEYLSMEKYEPSTDGEEKDWQALWKRFFNALTIEERRNERCQMNHCHKRFWRDMPEMKPF